MTATQSTEQRGSTTPISKKPTIKSRTIRKAQYLISGFIRETEGEYKLSDHTPDGVAKIMVLFYETAPESPMVIDNGSGLIKAGYGGVDAPQAVYPSIVGTLENSDNDYYIGNEVELNIP